MREQGRERLFGLEQGVPLSTMILSVPPRALLKSSLGSDQNP
jgi:hypothetical protein